jgi:cytochrome c oxidase assembly protein subunit 17
MVEEKSKSTENVILESEGKPIKPCCACPETKKPRDKCIMENGEENCKQLIEEHIACLRNLGFKV